MKDINNVRKDDGRRGIIQNMPEVVYHSIGRMNASSLASGLVDHNEIDPSRVKYEFELAPVPRTNAAQDRLDRGTLAHLFMLQPERLAEGVAIWHGDRRHGGEWSMFCDQNHGKLIVTSDDYNAVADACREFRAVPMVSQLLTEIDVEVAVFSNEDGIYTKNRLDAVKRGERCVIIDLKTTEAGISQKSVERTIRDHHYREKMAFYKRCYQRESGREVEACYNIFLLMTKPYSVRVEKFSEHALEWGQRRMLDCLDEVRRCLIFNRWPVMVKEGIVLVQEWEIRDEGQLEGFDDDN